MCLSLRFAAVIYVFFLIPSLVLCYFFFFLNDPAPPEISPLSLHAALPIFKPSFGLFPPAGMHVNTESLDTVGAMARSVEDIALFRAALMAIPYEKPAMPDRPPSRSEEHTSELQSHLNLVCRLLLEKKKTRK